MKAAVRRILDIYFAISIILAFVSFSMVVIDGVNKMTSGRFKIFEILNLNDVDIYALSDDGKTYKGYEFASKYMYDENAKDVFVWKVVNISTFIATRNIGLYWILWLVNVKYRKRYLKVLVIAFLIAALQAVAIRVYCHHSPVDNFVWSRYSTAYAVGTDLSTLMFAMIELTGIKSLIKKGSN